MRHRLHPHHVLAVAEVAIDFYLNTGQDEQLLPLSELLLNRGSRGGQGIDSVVFGGGSGHPSTLSSLARYSS